MEIDYGASRVVAPVERAASYIRRLCEVAYVYVHLEPTNACNTTCTVCPRAAMTRSPRLMDWTTYTKLMDQILPSPVPMLAFVGFGEPTIHKRLSDMIAFARDSRPDIVIKITTNGTLLEKASIEKLFDAGLDFIEISVMGLSTGEYERMMGGLSFRRLLEVIQELNETDRNYALTTFATGDASPSDVRSFWQGFGARSVEIKGLHRRGGYHASSEAMPKYAMGNYLKRSERKASVLPMDACHKLYMFLHVNADGRIIPCVQEINDKNILADTSTLANLDEIVRATRRHRPVFDICQGCELKDQDLIHYYATFFSRRFPDRLDIFEKRLDFWEDRNK